MPVSTGTRLGLRYPGSYRGPVPELHGGEKLLLTTMLLIVASPAQRRHITSPVSRSTAAILAREIGGCCKPPDYDPSERPGHA